MKASVSLLQDFGLILSCNILHEKYCEGRIRGPIIDKRFLYSKYETCEKVTYDIHFHDTNKFLIADYIGTYFQIPAFYPSLSLPSIAPFGH